MPRHSSKSTPRLLLRGALLSGVAILLAEGLARIGFGLGTPPLYEAHPVLEYRFKPNQRLRRFGNTVNINSYGMRSDPLLPSPNPGVLRILVFGDSVVFGGAQTDQRHIATSVLQRRLQDRNPLLEVGNVSAGSWGPGNWKGWAETYGFLGADLVLLVLSSHDAVDNPTFMPLNELSHPTRNPPSALNELICRYLTLDRFRYQFRSWGLVAHAPEPTNWRSLVEVAPSNERRSETSDPMIQGLADLKSFLVSAQASGAKVAVVQFWNSDEVQYTPKSRQYQAIKDLLSSMAIPVIQSGPLFRVCSIDPARELFVDAIHPYSLKGQACLADALKQAAAESGMALSSPPLRP